MDDWITRRSALGLYDWISMPWSLAEAKPQPEIYSKRRVEMTEGEYELVKLQHSLMGIPLDKLSNHKGPTSMKSTGAPPAPTKSKVLTNWANWKRQDGESDEAYALRLTPYLSDLAETLSAQGIPNFKAEDGCVSFIAGPILPVVEPTVHAPLLRACRADRRRQPGLLTLDHWIADGE